MNKKSILISGAVGIMTLFTLAENNARRIDSEDALGGHIASPTANAKPSDWDILVRALIQVESGGDSLAVGKTNDLGALQITPIYVTDVNRILGEECYTLEDRKSLVKSLEMFEIIQGHYNPSRDIDKAIRLHNPGAGDWYRERVYNEMNKIRDNVYESCL